MAKQRMIEITICDQASCLATADRERINGKPQIYTMSQMSELKTITKTTKERRERETKIGEKHEKLWTGRKNGQAKEISNTSDIIIQLLISVIH